VIRKSNIWKESLEVKGMRVNLYKTKQVKGIMQRYLQENGHVQLG